MIVRSNKSTLNYKPVIGLEVHVQLNTLSKLFAPDCNEVSREPNILGSITMSHPGTLPLLNRKAVEKGILRTLALGSSPRRELYFDRKSYFYPDLPKGFQITQLHSPLGLGGVVHFLDETGDSCSAPLIQIHLEEDAGKSVHDHPDGLTRVDLNRAGVPLLEIVTTPEIRDSNQAACFVNEIRTLVRWQNISDADMEKGSLPDHLRDGWIMAPPQGAEP